MCSSVTFPSWFFEGRRRFRPHFHPVDAGGLRRSWDSSIARPSPPSAPTPSGASPSPPAGPRTRRVVPPTGPPGPRIGPHRRPTRPPPQTPRVLHRPPSRSSDRHSRSPVWWPPRCVWFAQCRCPRFSACVLSLSPFLFQWGFQLTGIGSAESRSLHLFTGKDLQAFFLAEKGGRVKVGARALSKASHPGISRKRVGSFPPIEFHLKKGF